MARQTRKKGQKQKGGFYPSVMEGVRGAMILTPLAVRQAFRLMNSKQTKRRRGSGTRQRSSKRTLRKRRF